MLLKVALAFLLVMAVIGWLGSRLGRRTPLDRIRDRLGLGRACPACGRPRAGRGPCPCGQGRGRG